VHLLYLIGLQNRILVVVRWTASFVTRGRGARLITGEGVEAAAPAASPREPVRARAA